MKCVLIQKNTVYIENLSGEQLFFRSLEDLNKYTMHDLSMADGKSITYQPDDGIHVWDNVEMPIPQSEFEHLIDNLEAYKGIYEDPYSYVTLEEAKLVKLEEVMDLVSHLKRVTYEAGSSQLSIDGIQSLQDIQTQAVLALSVADTAWTIDVILENTNPDGTNVRMTLTATQVVNFIRNLWARNENYNQLAQDHVDAINLLTTVADVKAYNIRG